MSWENNSKESSGKKEYAAVFGFVCCDLSWNFVFGSLSLTYNSSNFLHPVLG